MDEEQRRHHQNFFGGGETSNSTMPDLRHFFTPTPTATTHFLPPLAPHHSNLFPPLPHHHHHDMALLMNSAADMDAGGGCGFGSSVDVAGGGGSARWPRQETLTLLEIRSRLDHKFKEANHKGPLWDEVSRIMSEEHGYQRSGKKCREKFENLYKYYKKTKEAKGGRQDGRHYRFFRQLEAIYGDQSTNNHHHIANSEDHSHFKIMADNPNLHFHNVINTPKTNAQQGINSISLSKSYSDLDTSSSEGERNGESSMDKRRSTRSWKAKTRDFIDSQMVKIMEKQEAWMEKMLRSLENKEMERMSREEERRKEDARRIEEEHKFWADERAWIEARDKALMDVVQRMTGKEVADLVGNRDINLDDQMVKSGDGWEESEITKLIELRTSMETRFEQCGGSEEGDHLWEEISARMVYWGHSRSARMCKEKWDSINTNINRECSRKRKDWRVRSQQHQQSNNQSSNFYRYGEMVSSQGRMGVGLGGANQTSDSCLRVLLGDGGETHVRKSYGVKLNKGETH